MTNLIPRNHIPFLIAVLVAQIGFAFYLPITQDEAYYTAWSQNLSWGYMDHPPFVAWMIALGIKIFGSIPFAVRLSSLIMSVFSIVLSYSFCRQLGLGRDSLKIAIILSVCSIPLLLGSFLTTPDTPLAFFWLLALHEFLAAYKGNKKRWFSTGIATAFGIMSKYTMFLIGPIFLICLLKKRSLLRTKWPWIGATVCLLTLTPHLYWNHQNEWLSFRFQINRGFASEYLSNQQKVNLPKIRSTLPNDPESLLPNYFITDSDQIKKIRKEKSAFAKLIQRTTSYAGAQVLVFGFLLFGLFFWKREKSKSHQTINKDAKNILKIATWFPLIFFGVISFWQHIEANWSCMFLIGASPLIASTMRFKVPGVILLGFLNIIAIAGIIVTAKYPHSQNNRLYKETHGYQSLSQFLPGNQVPIFADSYQLTAMLNFYRPSLSVSQFPGISRHSEFTRKTHWQQWDLKTIKQNRKFYLISDKLYPPSLEKFSAEKITEIRDCIGQSFELNHSPSNLQYKRTCPHIAHRWFLVQYRFDN